MTQPTYRYQFVHGTLSYPQGQIYSDCNAIIIKNTGATNIQLNGDVILPGDSITLAGLQGELDTTTYQVTYVGGAGSVSYWKKIYR